MKSSKYPNLWLTQQCVFCCSFNHIFLDPDIYDETFAWECWNCTAKHWISDEDKFEYMKLNNLNMSQADFDLANNNMKFFLGKSS